MGVMLDRRDSLNIVSDIEEFLKKNSEFATPPSNIAKGVNLNYNACKDYLKLIHFIQNMPKLIEIKKNKGVLYTVDKDLTSYSFEEQKNILKTEFGVTLDKSDKLYIGLLDKGITKKEKAIKLEESKIVSDGLKFKHLEKTKDNKIYLTKLGETIAKGAKRLFS